MCTPYHTSRDQYMVFLFFMRIHVGLAMCHASVSSKICRIPSRGRTQVGFFDLFYRRITVAFPYRVANCFMVGLLLFPVGIHRVSSFEIVRNAGTHEICNYYDRNNFIFAYLDQTRGRTNSQAKESQTCKHVARTRTASHPCFLPWHLEFPFIVIP